MKKLYSMLAMAAVGFSASALEPTELTFNNPSFEEKDETIIAGAYLPGWNIAGANATTVDADGNEVTTNLYAFQERNKSWTDGNVGMRSAADVAIDGGNYVWQELLGQQPGTYLLQFDGMITRNGWKGGMDGTLNEETGLPKQSGFAFLCDDYGDPDEEGTLEEPAEGLTALYVTDQSLGNTYFSLYRYYVVHTTHPDLEDETGIKFGFGYPNSCQPVTKARFAFDNFHVYYFDTMDTDAVKEYVDTEMIAPLREGYAEDADGNKLPLSVVNPSGNVAINLVGIVGNTPSTLGVSDVTVAPEPEFVGNGKTYNLQGIEVADPTQPGLYIRDGKKFIVK